MDVELEPEVILSRLEDAGVLEQVEEDELVLTDAFVSKVAEYRSEWSGLDEDDLFDAVSEVVGDRDLTGVLYDPTDGTNPAPAYVYGALDEYVSDLGIEQKIHLSTLLNTFRRGPPRDEGAPSAFAPVHGEDLPNLLKTHERAIVYLWRDDCDPCDTLRETFDRIFEEPPGDIGLFAVYGPDCTEFLRREYSVVGAPTTLFVLHGAVDARLIQAHSQPVFESEIETLRRRG